MGMLQNAPLLYGGQGYNLASPCNVKQTWNRACNPMDPIIWPLPAISNKRAIELVTQWTCTT
jgi:hypothetical protein